MQDPTLESETAPATKDMFARVRGGDVGHQACSEDQVNDLR